MFVRVLTILTLLLAGNVMAQDWTQWRGQNRDGALASFTEPRAWPEQLTQRWKVEVGLGYATPLVVGDRIYLFSRQEENEVMSALDATSGKVLWKTGYPAPFTMHSSAVPHGKGPKSTPVFANGKLYSIGMIGTVTAFDAATGKLTYLGSTPTEKQPRGFRIDPSGRFMIVSGEKSDTISAYAIDPSSGALKAIGKYPTGKGSNWVEIVAFD